MQITSQNYKQGEDLIFKIIPLDFSSDPDIFISKQNRNPQNAITSEWSCGQYGKDTCSIHHSKINIGDTFYIGTSCQNGECRFQLKSLLSQEFKLENGIEFQFYLESQEARVFKFKIPADDFNTLETDQVDMTEIKKIVKLLSEEAVIIKAGAYRSDAHDFTLFAKINCTTQNSQNSEALPSSDMQSQKGMFAWKKGQILRMGKSEFKNRTWEGCEVEILVDAVDSGEYHVMAQTNQAIPQLYNFEQVDDLVDMNRIQCYQYNIQNASAALDIYITTFSGRVDVAIEPALISKANFPKTLKEFAITRIGEHEAIIDIGAEKRNQLGQQKGLYYICVKGVFTSTYSIKVREEQGEQSRSVLEDGYAEQFQLKQNEAKTHIYQVPSLDYSDEDLMISINVVLSSGNTGGSSESLQLFARFCDEDDPEVCRTTAKNEMDSNNVTLISDKYFSGQHNGVSMQIYINHNEQMCKNQGNCYYVILMRCLDNNITVYEITVQHSQNNHKMLKENKPFIDEVDQQSFMYYKFIIPPDEHMINVTFELLPIHGDCDLYTSTTQLFPNKTDYEKRSMRVGSHEDLIKYSIQDPIDSSFLVGTLAHTYYIGVYGYSYSSFGILAKIERNQENSEDYFKQKSVQLYENIPYTKTMINEFDYFFSYFEINMSEQDERAIIVTSQILEQKSLTYMSYNRVPTPEVHDYRIKDTSLWITPGQPDYHNTGTYYLLTVPLFGYAQLFTEDYYRFQLIWKFESAISHLNANQPQRVDISSQDYVYLKHYLMETESDIRISAVEGGQVDLFVSANPKNFKPSDTNFDFSSRNQSGSGYMNEKSLILSFAKIKEINPSCVDLGYADEQPCIIYIGVLCREDYDCYQSKVDLEYLNNKPIKLNLGTPKHLGMFPDTYNYYYIIVNRKSGQKNIHAVLSPLIGEADLYCNIETTLSDPSTWSLPQENKALYESKLKLKTDIISLNIPQQEGNQSANYIVIFGIHASKSNSQREDQLTHYNFIVYENIVELQDNIPFSGQVKENQFSYFLYQQQRCMNCAILVTLSSNTNGNADLYVSVGENSPPTLLEYDLKLATQSSEILSIVPAKIPKANPEGVYVIGVYGQRDTTFQIGITSSQDVSLAVISEGNPLRNSQNANETIFYQYYNWDAQDIEIEIQVPSGEIDLLVNTYQSWNGDTNQNIHKQSLVNQLPSDIQNSMWHVEGINPMTQADKGQELLILKKDRNYCSDCIYLIGVQTKEQRADYSIIIRNIIANQNYTHLMKVGEVKVIKFENKGSEAVYQFITGLKEPIKILPTLIQGSALIYLSFDERKEHAIQKETAYSNMLIGDPFLKTDTNYYIIVESQSDNTELTLVVEQQFQTITLHDGIPQVLYYSDYEDSEKYLQFALSPGNSTVVMTIKSKTQNFYPVIYYNRFVQNEVMIYPPTDMIPYQTYGKTEWDKDLQILKHTVTFDNVPQDQRSYLAINIQYYMEKVYNSDTNEEIKPNKTEATALITISKASTLKLVPYIEYLGDLPYFYSFNQFLIQPVKGKVVVVSLAQCLGGIKASVIKSDNLNVKSRLELEEKNGWKEGIVTNQDQKFYLMIEPEMIGFPDFSKREYLISIKYINQQEYTQEAVKYESQDHGHIQVEFLPHSQLEIQFTWNELRENYVANKTVYFMRNVKYILYESTNPHAKLDSICAAKRRVDSFKSLGHVINKTTFKTKGLTPGEIHYFNIFAFVLDKYVAVPYKPVEIYIPAQEKQETQRILLILALVLFLLMIVLVCSQLRGKKFKQKLYNEIREITESQKDLEEAEQRQIGDQVEVKVNKNELVENLDEFETNRRMIEQVQS